MQASSIAAVSSISQAAAAPRWTVAEVLALYEMPLMDLIWRAQGVHREHFDPNAIQRSTLLSVKTGGCSEDCSYCSQSARYDTETQRERLMPLDEVIAAAKVAKEKGASRFCMGAAWKGPKDNDLDRVLDMVREVKALGMQTCVTLGMLGAGQAEKLKEAGLDYYNHNLDTDKEFYGQVIKTHTHDDRLDTLEQVREAGAAGFLVLGAAMVPDVHRDDGQRVVLVQNHFQAVVQAIALVREVQVGGEQCRRA